MWFSEKATYVIHWVKHKNQSAKISLFVIATQAFFKPIIKELPPAIFRGHFTFWQVKVLAYTLPHFCGEMGGGNMVGYSDLKTILHLSVGSNK